MNQRHEFVEAGLQWGKKLATTCLWVSGIATGLLIYKHFSEKWSAAGLPSMESIAAVESIVSGRGVPATNVANATRTPAGSLNTNQQPVHGGQSGSCLEVFDYDG